MFKVKPWSLFSVLVLGILLERMSLPKIHISYFRILALGVITVVALQAVRFRRFSIPKALIFLALWLIVPAMLGVEGRNLSVLLQYLFSLVLAVVVYSLLPDRFSSRQQTAMALLLAVVAGIGAVTLITDYFGWTKFTLLFSQEIYNEAQSGRGAGILGGETNFTAARLSTLLPFAIYLMLKKNALKYSSFWAIPLVLLILLGVILTGSRMGYLAVAQIVLVLVFYEVGTSSWTGKLAAVLTVVVLMGIGAYSFTLLKNQSKALLRLQSLGSIQDLSVANLDNSEFDDSLLNRFILFWIGVHIIQTHPLMGVGIGNAKYIPPRYFPFESQIKYLHNTYLEFGAENGLPALLGFLLFLGYLLVRLGGRGWRSRDDFRFYLALGLYILLFNWFFLTDLYNKLFWVVFLPVTIRFLQADRGSHDVSR